MRKPQAADGGIDDMKVSYTSTMPCGIKNYHFPASRANQYDAGTLFRTLSRITLSLSVLEAVIPPVPSNTMGIFASVHLLPLLLLFRFLGIYSEIRYHTTNT